MNDRKHCPECDVHYASESSHALVHAAIVQATLRASDPVGTTAHPAALPAAS